MPDGAQRLRQSGGGSGQQDVRVGGFRGFEQPGQERGCELRHIAGADQIPVRRGGPEGGQNTAERSLAGKQIGNRGKSGNRGEGRVADQDRASGGLAHGLGDGGNEWPATEGEERFVSSHTRAAASRQHVARPTHSKMIPLKITRARRRLGLWYLGFGNISMRFCSILLIAGLAQAADPPRPARQITSVVIADPRTGRLVRSVIVSPNTVVQKQVGEKQVTATVIAPRVAAPTAVTPEDLAETRAPSGIDEAVEQIAARYSLSSALLHSVIKVESNYNPYAVSRKGAQGLMQLIPETARRFGVGNSFNPLENIEGGARYLRYLIDLYGADNRELVLAAYNAGEAAVAKYGGVPPYRETQNYLLLVKKQLDKAIGARQTVAPQPPTPKPVATESGPAHIMEIVETDGTVRYVSR